MFCLGLIFYAHTQRKINFHSASLLEVTGGKHNETLFIRLYRF